MALVSVIVPIYNVSRYLRQCIDSIVGQSYKDIEIILVDDGSTDGCSQICDDYAYKDSRVKVIHKKNEGLVKARKTGFLASRGDYISFVDGDDWIEPDMLEKLYLTLISENVDVVMCGRYEDDEDTHRMVYHGIHEGRYDKNGLIDEVYPKMIVNNVFFEWGIFPSYWDKLFKRNCIEPYLMAVDDRINMGEDAACVYPCILNSDSIYIIKKCYYHYRQTPLSMVRKAEDEKKERERFRILYKTVLQEFDKYKYIYDLREQWKKYVLFLMVPRADYLYEGIEKLDYLFPFTGVKRGSRIIIYCAGLYGQRLYNYIKKTNYCEVVALADRNYMNLNRKGIQTISPDSISEYEFDNIIIASSFAKARAEIYNDLSKKYTEEKVHILNERIIMSEDTFRKLGLA